MLPSLSDVRYAGTDDFTVAVARSALTALQAHTSSVLPAGSVTADYSDMFTKLGPFLTLWNRESDDKLSAEAIGAVVKYWVKTGWGQDLRCDPRTNAKLLWRVSAKDADYQNRDDILPPGQATLADGEFKEFRPFGSIPGTMRLFEGTNNWWCTDNGTHGGRAACRAADWWVWPKGSRTWHDWTIAARWPNRAPRRFPT
jgi:hypothetical protein